MKYFGFEQLCSSFPLPIYYDRATDLIYNLIKRLYSLSYIIHYYILLEYLAALLILLSNLGRESVISGSHCEPVSYYSLSTNDIAVRIRIQFFYAFQDKF